MLRWVHCYRDNFKHAVMTITNGLERQHEQLEYSFLADYINGSLSDLVTAVVKQFVSSTHHKSVITQSQSQSQFLVFIICPMSYDFNSSFNVVNELVYASNTPNFQWCLRYCYSTF